MRERFQGADDKCKSNSSHMEYKLLNVVLLNDRRNTDYVCYIFFQVACIFNYN